MYAHVFVAPVEGRRGEESPYDADWMVHQTGVLTTYPTNQVITLKIFSSNIVSKVDAISLYSICYSALFSMVVAAAAGCERRYGWIFGISFRGGVASCCFALSHSSCCAETANRW